MKRWFGYIWHGAGNSELMVIQADTYRQAWNLFRKSNKQLHTSRLRIEPASNELRVY